MKKTWMTIIPAVIIVLVLIATGVFVVTNKKDSKEASNIQTVEEMKNMVDKIYKNLGDKLPNLETSEIDVSDEDQVKTYTGLKSNKDVEKLVISVPFIGSQAYSLAVVKVSKDADVEKMKQEMLDNIDTRRWICVSAEKVYVTNNGNIIFLVMSSEEWAKPVYDEFKKFVGNKIGKELEKSEDSDFDLPPEMNLG